MPFRYARACMHASLIALNRGAPRAEARGPSIYACARFGSATAIFIASALAGCASSPRAVKMEATPVADQLGFPGCSVSVPLSQPEVIQSAKRAGNPTPESYPEWTAMTASIQPGDQIRLVDCMSVQRSRRVGDPYYYALFRGGRVVAKFHFIVVN